MTDSQLQGWRNAVDSLREVLQSFASREVQENLRLGYSNGFDSADLLLMFEDFYEIVNAPHSHSGEEKIPPQVLDRLRSFYSRSRL